MIQRSQLAKGEGYIMTMAVLILMMIMTNKFLMTITNKIMIYSVNDVLFVDLDF